MHLHLPQSRLCPVDALTRIICTSVVSTCFVDISRCAMRRICNLFTLFDSCRGSGPVAHALLNTCTCRELPTGPVPPRRSSDMNLLLYHTLLSALCQQLHLRRPDSRRKPSEDTTTSVKMNSPPSVDDSWQSSLRPLPSNRLKTHPEYIYTMNLQLTLAPATGGTTFHPTSDRSANQILEPTTTVQRRPKNSSPSRH